MEFVKLENSEAVYGKKNLLQTQIKFLTVMKRFKYYNSLRSKETKRKTEFKKNLTELKKEIRELDKLLPESHYKEPKKEEKESPQQKKYKKGRRDLEFEIAEIQAKLSRLQ